MSQLCWCIELGLTLVICIALVLCLSLLALNWRWFARYSITLDMPLGAVGAVRWSSFPRFAWVQRLRSRSGIAVMCARR